MERTSEPVGFGLGIRKLINRDLPREKRMFGQGGERLILTFGGGRGCTQGPGSLFTTEDTERAVKDWAKVKSNIHHRGTEED